MCAHQLSAANTYLAPVRKIHSLRQADIEVAAVELQQLSNGWGMDRHDDCDGDIMLLLTPHEAEISAAGFILTRTASGIQLALVEGDDYEVVGNFVDRQSSYPEFIFGNGGFGEVSFTRRGV